MDIDLFSRLPLSDFVGKRTRFITSWDSKHKRLFQAILGAVPRHPMVLAYLRIMASYFDGQLELRGWVGPSALRRAYDEYISDTHNDVESIQMLQEDQILNLSAPLGTRRYPSIPVQYGYGCCCNFVVVDPRTGMVPFYSRVVIPTTQDGIFCTGWLSFRDQLRIANLTYTMQEFGIS